MTSTKRQEKKEKKGTTDLWGGGILSKAEIKDRKERVDMSKISRFQPKMSLPFH